MSDKTPEETEPPPPYSEAQNYSQFVVPEASVTGAQYSTQTSPIFTYNTSKSAPPLGPAHLAQPRYGPVPQGQQYGSPGYPTYGFPAPGFNSYNTSPSAPPLGPAHPIQPAYGPAPQGHQYGSPSYPTYGSPAAGFSSYIQTYRPSPAAAYGYSGAAQASQANVAYDPYQGTVHTYSVPAGYTTTPIDGNTRNTVDGMQLQKIALLVAFLILIIIIMGVILS